MGRLLHRPKKPLLLLSQWQGDMLMGPLYLNEQGTKVSRIGRRLVVSKDEQELASIPIHQISRLVLMGQIQITTSALSLLLDRHIPVVLTTQKGYTRGSLISPLTPHLTVRKAQYTKSQDNEFCMKFARDLVSARAASAANVIRRYLYNHRHIDLKNIIGQIAEYGDLVESQTTIDSLRGVEGIISREYFAGLVEIFKDLQMNFNGRIRRPPEDPINACLSYVYVLLTSLVENAIQTTSLDVYCGFFHLPNRSAPALALDMVEQFRQPVGDRFVMLLFNKKILQENDFQIGQGDVRPVLLTEKAKKRLIAQWEDFLNTPQRLLENQPMLTPQQLIFKKAEELESAIKNDVQFSHFRLSI